VVNSPNPSETWRSFIAIELPADVRARITQHIDRLRREFPDVRASWTRADNLHLTLKFLGNIPVSRVSALSEETEAAARTNKPFELVIAGCGTFPPYGQPKVLWIGINDVSSNLQQLYLALEDRCAEAGFDREVRPYHPHLTIARLRARGGSRELAQAHRQLVFANQTFTASELVVFKSELRSEGSKHTVTSRHRLG